MSVAIDLGQVLTAVMLGLFVMQGRQLIGELRALRLDVTHLQRWAMRKADYEPRAENG
ncbi:MAG: hypothetical protein NVS9B2_27870 [Steroidobacteraceae bacterium]